MKILCLTFIILGMSSSYAQTLAYDLKLLEISEDGRQAHFEQGNPMHATTNVFGMIHCLGSRDGNSFLIEDRLTHLTTYAEFSSQRTCKAAIKKAKGFMGMRYGTLRFFIDPIKRKVLSFIRL